MALGPGSPVLSVQVAFSTDPNSAGAGSPTWTTLVGRVLAIDCARSSRSDELGTYQAGTATITLWNADGAFNPTNASGPYFGQLLPWRPIRIQAKWAGVTYTRWQGYVQQWPQTWVDPSQGISRIVCTDAYGALNQIDLDSAYAAEVLLDSPTVYYPMSESSGATTAGNASGNSYPPAQIVHTKTANAAHLGTYQFGQTLDVAGAAAQTGLQLAGYNAVGGGTPEDGYLLQAPNLPVPWGAFTVELWAQAASTAAVDVLVMMCQLATPNGPTSGATPIAAAPNAPDGMIQIADFSGQNIYVTLFTPDGGNPQVIGNVPGGALDLYHLAATWTAGSPGTLTVYINGVSVGTATPAACPSTATVTSLTQIGAQAVNGQTLPGSSYVLDGSPTVGTLAHFAFYPSALSAGRIAAHYQAGATAFAGELSGARATRLLSYGGWQSALQSVQTGRSTMSPASGIQGTSLLAALQTVAEAEQGTLTVTSDGKVDQRGRDDRMTKRHADAAIVFGSNQAGGEIPYSLPNASLVLDDTLIVNDWQISRPNGITAESADLTSIQKFWPRGKQLTMNVDTDDQVQQAADWLLDREGYPIQRLQQLTIDAGNINGTTFSALWPALLTMDLHKRATVNHRPVGAPVTSMDGFVEQMHDIIDFQASTWQFTTWLSPIVADYLIPDDSVQGATDSTFVVAF